MEIRVNQVVLAFRRKWKLLLVLPLVFALLALAMSLMLPKSYLASSQVFIPLGLTDSASISRDATTYNTLVSSGPVLDRVILELGLNLGREELRAKIHSRVLAGEQFIEISVSDSNPRLAADIVNSIARNFEVQVVDLTLGEYQRNLDNLVHQSDQLQGQITVIEARLADLDVPENEDDDALQADIRLLRSDRLELSQLKADIDATVRELSSQMRMSTTSVVVADYAEPPARQSSPQPALMTLVGLFLGVLGAAALTLGLSLFDSRFRDGTQVVSGPVLGRLNATDPLGSGIKLLAARLHSAGNGGNGQIVVVSPRGSSAPESIAVKLDSSRSQGGPHFAAAANLLEDVASIDLALQSTGAVVIAESGETLLDDLEEVASVLASMQVPVLGTLILNAR
jgi:capsular polysaccharide biosynthesis protein